MRAIGRCAHCGGTVFSAEEDTAKMTRKGVMHASCWSDRQSVDIALKMPKHLRGYSVANYRYLQDLAVGAFRWSGRFDRVSAIERSERGRE